MFSVDFILLIPASTYSVFSSILTIFSPFISIIGFVVTTCVVFACTVFTTTFAEYVFPCTSFGAFSSNHIFNSYVVSFLLSIKTFSFIINPLESNAGVLHSFPSSLIEYFI